MIRLILAIIALLAMVAGIFGVLWAEPSVPPLHPSKYDERLDALDREAVEAAYRQQVGHLFGVWMKDKAGQPTRALVGQRNARKAYIDIMQQIENRR